MPGKSNTKFTEKERFLIGKYTAINGPSTTVRKFQTSHPHLKFGESQARALRKKYLDQQKKSPKRGRPLMLGALDEKVRNFLQIVRRKGGVVNTVVAIATAKALIEKSDQQHLKNLDLERSSWAKSLFQRMGFVRRAKTTSKPEKPERAKSEAALILHHQIVDLVEKHHIPPSMVINIDQTPLKYAPVSNQSMAQKGSSNIAIHGSTYKNAITATFGITYDNQFLPMQLIYGGKTLQSLPRFEFPKSFSLSANEKHFSNTTESLKLLDEIIIPYVISERERQQLDINHRALLLMDVFRGQMTEPVLKKLRENNSWSKCRQI